MRQAANTGTSVREGSKQRMTIVTVDPSQRLVEGKLRDGKDQRVTITDIPVAFRWPAQGELWTIILQNGTWNLGTHIHENEEQPIEDVPVGAVRIDGSPVQDSLGRNLLTIDDIDPGETTPDATSSVKGKLKLTGDLAGTADSPQIAAGAIVNADISASAAISTSKLAVNPLARANHTGTQAASTISDFAAAAELAVAGDIATASTADRNRANHTGTQLASTISDFSSAAVTAVAPTIVKLVVMVTPMNINVNVAAGASIGDVVSGDRILLVGQTTTSQNGIWKYNGNGAALTRESDSNSDALMPQGSLVLVTGAPSALRYSIWQMVDGTYSGGSTWSNDVNWIFGTKISFDTSTNRLIIDNESGAIRLSTSVADLDISNSSIDVDSRPIVNVDDPTNAQDAATKNYVDTHTNPGGSAPDAPIIASISSASSYAFTGLDGNTDGIYEITFGGSITQGSTQRSPYITVNSDTTTANYAGVAAFAYSDGTDGSVALSGLAGMPLGFFPHTSDGEALIRVLVYTKSGINRLAQTHISSHLSGRSGDIEASGWWLNTSTNITSLTLNFGGATATGTIMLRKMESPSTVVPGPRIVRGSVSSSGSIVSGSGYSVARTGTGTYTLTFTTPFTTIPVVTLTRAKGLDGAIVEESNTSSRTTSNYFVQGYDPTNPGTPLDAAFDFVAVDSSTAGVSSWSAPSRVTTLPSSQPNGTEVYYQPDPTSNPGVLWHMRYDAVAAKWDFLGGSQLYFEATSSQTISNTTYADVTGNVLSYTVPVAGIWNVMIGSRLDSNATAAGQTSMRAVQGTTTAVEFFERGDNWQDTERVRPCTLTTGTIKTQFQTATGDGRVLGPTRMAIWPVRIG